MSVESITATPQHLSFQLAEEDFAIEISKVREVLDYPRITKVPQMPEFMRGVINLRGSVVPVVDQRMKFGMPQAEKTVDTRIIIMELAVEGESTVVGALADSVHEVMELEPENIEPAPKIGTRLNTDFIRGMGKRDENFVMILDVDRLFSSDELALVSQTNLTGEMLQQMGAAEQAPELVQ